MFQGKLAGACKELNDRNICEACGVFQKYKEFNFLKVCLALN